MRQHEHVCSNLFASCVQTNQAKPSCSHRNSELSLFRAGEVGICSGVIGSVLMLTMDLKKSARMLFMRWVSQVVCWVCGLMWATVKL